MRHLSLVALGVTALVTVGTNAADPLEFGMEMSVRAYDAVCWYENLKHFPDTHSKDYNKCSGKQKYQKTQIETNEFFKEHPELKEEYFGNWTDDKAIEYLPAPYKDACSKYLGDSKAQPESDESDALNDGGSGKDYPYRGYAYCLLSTLRTQRGVKAIEAVVILYNLKKNWMQCVNDRTNEFRARHNSENLTLSKDLNDAAQGWATTLAKECKSYHSKNTDEGRKFKGNGTGESLHAGGGEDDKETSAYQAADGWYEEIRDYPYPDGYQDDDPALFKKIGHFTQSVWKGSKYVGYGYAYNSSCKPYTRFLVARFFPAGNVKGKYFENVDPPNDDSKTGR